MDEDSYVETSDAEEREELPVSKNFNWVLEDIEEGVYHRDDNPLPQERLKLEPMDYAMNHSQGAPLYSQKGSPGTRRPSRQQSEVPDLPSTTPQVALKSISEEDSCIHNSLHLCTTCECVLATNRQPSPQDPFLLSPRTSRGLEIDMIGLFSSPPTSSNLNDIPRITSTQSFSNCSRSQSLESLSLFSAPSPSTGGLSTFSSTPTTHENHLTSQISPSSPLSSPLSQIDTANERVGLDTITSSSTLDPPTNEKNRSINNLLLDSVDSDHMSHPSRYPLRQRGPNQLKPYTIEKFQYKMALSSNPEAIVKVRSPTRARHQRYSPLDNSGEESQEPWEMDEAKEYGSSGDEAYRQKSNVKSRSFVVQTQLKPSLQYPDILQDLPSTDEEEARELRELSKEARRAIRKRRAHDSKEARKRPGIKPFPLPRGMLETPRPTNADIRDSNVSLDSTFWASLPNQGPATPVLTPHSPPSLHEFHDDLRLHSPTRSTNSTDPTRCEGHNHLSDTSKHSDNDDNGSENLVVLDVIARKRLKALNKMVPAFMVNQLIKDDGTLSKSRNKRQHSIISSSDEEHMKLPPGQTRTKLAENPRDVWEIKGDTESSDGDHSTSSSASVKTNLNSDTLAQRSYGHDISNNAGNSDDSSDGVDDEQIHAYLNESLKRKKPTGRSRRQEESLIDWMLAKTRTVGVHKRSKAQKSTGTGYKHARNSSKYNVYTCGSRRFGRERQTLLNFKQPPKEQASPNQRQGDHLLSRGQASDVNNNNRDYSHNTGISISSHDTSQKGRKRRKKRQTEVQAHGLYTFPSNNTHVITGRREMEMVTVDIEDEDFYQALAPLSQDQTKSSHFPRTTEFDTNPRPPTQLLPSQSTVGDNYAIPFRDTHRYSRRRIHDDFDIPVLHSGLSFGPKTYLGKGWLHELISIVSSDTRPMVPAITVLRKLELDPAMSVEHFSRSLEQIFDGLFDLATGLPGLDDYTDEIQEWRTLQHIAGQLLSWFLVTATKDDSIFLRNTVEEQTLNSILRMRKLSLKSGSMDPSTFSICWFMIELSARLGISFLTPAPTVLGESILLLVHSLLEYGLTSAMAPIRGGLTLDGTSTAQIAAELWICLFHLLDTCYHTSSIAGKQIHPFWKVIKEVLESTNLQKSCLEASETIWSTIFSLCALAQFSAHGMTTATSRLPAYWELVVLALKKIRLVADPVADYALSSASLDKRDEYIGLVTLRCFHLWNRWHWQLGEASILFNQLVEIFKSRKFANLRHETPDYPTFMLLKDWTLLSKHGRGDTAFVLFLKLLVQAADHDDAKSNRTLSPRAKKLLSLAIPVGSLPFSKKSPTVVQDLSMLYNRLSAVAIGLYLDPSHHVSRVLHARTYVDFRDANDTTRLAVNRGMMNLAILMKNTNVPLDGIVGWIEAIADTLVDEYKNLSTPTTASADQNHTLVLKDRLFFSIQVLIGSVRKIIDVYRLRSEYPEPALLASLTQIFLNQSLTNVSKTTNEIRRLLQSFFEGRKLILPKPERSQVIPRPLQENQESQDEYGTIEMDYDDPALLAALGVDIQLPPPLSDIEVQEKALKVMIENSHLLWLSWRHLSKLVQDPPDTTHFSDEYYNQLESWLDCWLGCAHVLTRAGGKSWTLFLDLTKTWTNIPGDRQQRIDLILMLSILKLDPMSYIELKDQYFEVLVTSLVSKHSTQENEFIALLLSVDGCRHPLLAGLDTMDEHISPREHRYILRTLMNNLSNRLEQEATGDQSIAEDNQKYVGFCIKMFQSMKSTCFALDADSESRKEYVTRCRDVFQIMQDYRALWSHPRLMFWVTWERSLSG